MEELLNLQATTSRKELIMTTTLITPTLTAGTWSADAVHSDVSFKVRHMAVGKAKGTFALKSATLVVGENGIADASVTAEIDAASVDTKQEQRDAHVRSADFLDAENHPVLTFVSTGLKTSTARSSCSTAT